MRTGLTVWASRSLRVARGVLVAMLAAHWDRGPLVKTSIRPGTCLDLADCLRAAIASDGVHLAELRLGMSGAGAGCYLLSAPPGTLVFGAVGQWHRPEPNRISRSS